MRQKVRQAAAAQDMKKMLRAYQAQMGLTVRSLSRCWTGFLSDPLKEAIVPIRRLMAQPAAAVAREKRVVLQTAEKDL